MDPEPSTSTSSLRASWHRRRNLEIGMQRPHTGLVHAENGEIFGLDGGRVGFVGDGEGAATEVVDACCVELGEVLTGRV